MALYQWLQDFISERMRALTLSTSVMMLDPERQKFKPSDQQLNLDDMQVEICSKGTDQVSRCSHIYDSESYVAMSRMGRVQSGTHFQYSNLQP